MTTDRNHNGFGINHLNRTGPAIVETIGHPLETNRKRLKGSSFISGDQNEQSIKKTKTYVSKYSNSNQQDK